MTVKVSASIALAAIFAISDPAITQDHSFRAAENPAPGVEVVHPDKVPIIDVNAADLEAVIKDRRCFIAAKAVLGDNGIPSVEPTGTTNFFL